MTIHPIDTSQAILAELQAIRALQEQQLTAMTLLRVEAEQIRRVIRSIRTAQDQDALP